MHWCQQNVLLVPSNSMADCLLNDSPLQPEDFKVIEDSCPRCVFSTADSDIKWLPAGWRCKTCLFQSIVTGDGWVSYWPMYLLPELSPFIVNNNLLIFTQPFCLMLSTVIKFYSKIPMILICVITSFRLSKFSLYCICYVGPNQYNLMHKNYFLLLF